MTEIALTNKNKVIALKSPPLSLNLATKSDFWDLRPFKHLTRVMSRQKDKESNIVIF